MYYIDATTMGFMMSVSSYSSQSDIRVTDFGVDVSLLFLWVVVVVVVEEIYGIERMENPSLSLLIS